MRIALLPGLTLRDFAPPDTLVRSVGCHLTDITKIMLVKLDPKRYGTAQQDADTKNWQEVGFMWEDILGTAFTTRGLDQGGQGVRWRPGEVTLDGVAGSPDSFECGIQDDDPAIVVAEYKATWKSCRDIDSPSYGAGLMDSKFVGYLLQLKAYCKMVGTTRARLYIIFMNGDYERYVPALRCYQIDFDQRELDEQWASFLSTARREGLLT
jgi:hypothetical protein